MAVADINQPFVWSEAPLITSSYEGEGIINQQFVWSEAPLITSSYEGGGGKPSSSSAVVTYDELLKSLSLEALGLKGGSKIRNIKVNVGLYHHLVNSRGGALLSCVVAGPQI